MKKSMILVLCLGVFLALSGTDSWGACGGITTSGNVSGNKAGWTQIGTVPKDSRMWVNASGTVDFGCTFCTCVDGPTAGVEGTLQSFKQVFNLLGQALNPLNALNPVDGFQKSVDAVKNLFGSTQQPNYDQGGVWIKVLKKNGSPYIATQLYYYWAHEGGINKYGLPINEDVNVYAKAHDGGKNPEATNSYGDNHGAYYVTMKTLTTASAPSTTTKVTAPAAPTGYFVIQQGTDLPGQDYYKFTTKGDYAECDNQCGRDQKCQAYTWVKPGVQGADAVCWLKSGVPKQTQNPNCVSGVRKAQRASTQPGSPVLRHQTPIVPSTGQGTRIDVKSCSTCVGGCTTGHTCIYVNGACFLSCQ